MGRRSGRERAWATGGMVFAATMLLMVGVWQVFVGIAAIADDGFLVAVRGYTYDIDTTAWGWMHVALGALVILTGFFLFTGAAYAVSAPSEPPSAWIGRALFWLALLAGAASVVVGVLMLVWPDATLGVAAVLFGLWLLVHGVLRISEAVMATWANPGASGSYQHPKSVSRAGRGARPRRGPAPAWLRGPRLGRLAASRGA